MNYIPLATKYRPQTMADVIGQDAIVTTLQNAVRTERVGQAYLFSGPRGTGKTTMARLLSKALNCMSPDMCDQHRPCHSCYGIQRGNDIDVWEIDGASNNGVEHARKLQDNCAFAAAGGGFKIFIIDEVHMLSKAAFNTLLKVLEEPPVHVKFILCTTEPGKVPDTVASRCQPFNFRVITIPDIAKGLKRTIAAEGKEYEEDVIFPLCKLADGSMRDALSILDRLMVHDGPITLGLLQDSLGLPKVEQLLNVLWAVSKRDYKGALLGVDQMVMAGIPEAEIADALLQCMRDLMILITVGPNKSLLSFTPRQMKIAQGISKSWPLAGILPAVEWLQGFTGDRPLLDSIIIRMIGATRTGNAE